MVARSDACLFATERAAVAARTSTLAAAALVWTRAAALAAAFVGRGWPALRVEESGRACARREWLALARAHLAARWGRQTFLDARFVG